jgi:hypothetical protein
MAEHEAHSVDAREVAGVQRVLTANRRPRLGPEQAREGGDDAIQNRDARDVQRAAPVIERLAQIRRQQGEDDHARQRLDHAQDLIDLRAVAHERPDVLDRDHAFELSHAGARHRRHGLTGRIRNEVEMDAHGKLPGRNVGGLGTIGTTAWLYPNSRRASQ